MYDDTIKICNSVKECGYKLDGVIGFARGGVVPAAICSHYFDVPAHFVNWSLRDGKKKDTRAVDQLAAIASTGKKFLVIDDIIDSGDTLQQFKERIIGVSDNFVFASLWFNPSQSKSQVHFYARVIDRSIDTRWVSFPWEYDVKDFPPEGVQSANKNWS